MSLCTVRIATSPDFCNFFMKGNSSLIIQCILCFNKLPWFFGFFLIILYFLLIFHLLFQINICCTLKIDSDVSNSFFRNVLSIKIVSNTEIPMFLSHTDIPVSCCDTHRSHKLHTFVVTYFPICFNSCCAAHKKIQQCRTVGLLQKT